MAATRVTAVGGVAAALLLALSGPPPHVAVRQLRDADPAGAPTDLLVAVLTLVSSALVAWLALTVLLTAVGRLPGTAGTVARSAVRVVAPAAVRRAVELTLGVGLATGALGAGPAAAVTPHAGVSIGSTASDLPALGQEPGAPDGGIGARRAELDWPLDVRVPAAEAPAPAAEVPTLVVVRPGDTLWGLAEQGLRASGEAAPSTAQVAQAWPLWWSANRAVIGDDPDLILPGTALVPPTTSTATQPP